MKSIEFFKPFIYRGEITPYLISNKGNIYSKLTKKLLKPYINNSGYYGIRLNVVGCPAKHFLVHRLVALIFIKNPLNKPEVNHKNGNKADNSVGNLEWVTMVENKIHAKINQLISYNGGFDNPSNKYSPKTIEKICQLLATREYKYREIAEMCGVSKSTVQDINQGKRYREISQKYLQEDDVVIIKNNIKNRLFYGEYMEEYVYNGIETNLYITNFGRVFNKNTGCEVIPYSRKDYIYKAVAIHLANGKKMTILVHTMVGETFVTNPNNTRYIIHLDKNPNNCRAENLKYVSYKEKMKFEME